MVIDDSTTARERIQGDYRQLNINVGIYLGGVDSKTAAMFNHDLRFFRGTFSNVLFNTMDLVDMGRQITDPTSVKEVSWDIDPIFSAPRDSPVSFLSETSFVSFSHIHPTNERTVSFLVKTQTATALLLYSFTHVTNEKHYIALEIINHKLKLSIGKDGSIISLEAQQELRDQWHQIDITVSPTYLELVIDGIRNMKKLEEKVSAIYGGVIYVGGVNQNARAAARQDSLESLQSENGMKGGILGCVDKLVINSRAYNIHNIHSSRLISSHCGTDSKCEGGRCGMEPPGKASVEMTPHSDSNRDEFQLLAVNPVVVGEGSQVTLSTDNIEIVYDFKQLGIRESGIMIYVVKKPKYGEIEVDLGRRRNSDVFTYLDILGKKVKYKHFGSEEVYDEVLMEVEIVASSRSTEDQFPERIQQRFDFVLPVTIRPVNDAPEIVLQNNGILRIIENTKVRISPEFLYTNDADTSPSQLTYIVIEPPNQGYFERSGRSGERITEFTQAEVNNRDIWFLHIGSGNAQVSLKVNDGHSSSDPARIFVQTVQLNLTVLKNTGLLLPQGSFCKISTENLTTVSNVPEQEVEIRYDVRRTPRYGVLERQQYANGEWQEVSSFAQRHIDNGHVRYRSLGDTDAPLSDEFSFTVTANSYSTPFSFFRIQFEQVYLKVEESKLVLLHEPYGTLTQENLHASTNNPQLLSGKIVYELIRPPSMGNFFKIQGPSGLGRHVDFTGLTPLSQASYFTQEDINSGKIYYNLKTSAYENIKDFTDMRVHTVGTDAKTVRLWIEFLPQKSDVTFISNGLKDVIEGGQKGIDRFSLFVQTDQFRVFEFTVTSKPKYGVLSLIDPRSSVVVSQDVNTFTTNDIKDNRLVYQHDDSEHDTDSFTFTAVPDISRASQPHNNIPEYTGTFEIQMLMRNDKPPERLVDKVFHVVKNDEKLLTIDDLAFTDPDINFDPANLVYTRRRISNGQFLSARNRSQIYQFKQRDLTNREILFKHYGEDNGRADIDVTDGQFYTNCVLEIKAGPPVLRISENTGSRVKNGQRATIATHNLTVETNMNIDESEIHFVLREQPKHGNLEIDGKIVDEFVYKDLILNRLEYNHKGKSSDDDYFTFTLVAKDLEVDGHFSIDVVLQSSQQPPRVINNRGLKVFVGRDRNVIKQSDLLITQSDTDPANMEYLILVLPKHGDIYVKHVKLVSEVEMTFTQTDINDGNVEYEPVVDSATTDQFIFEVSNGVEALRGLEFMIDIVPYSLSLHIQNFSVIEGGKKILSSEQIKVDENFSQKQNLVFTLKEQPNYGRVELDDRKGIAIDSFTSNELARGLVSYVHDNSESKLDYFSITVSEGSPSKESEIASIYVEVEGINDEAPMIVQNLGLKVWRGSMTQITPEILSARDPDSSAEELVYRISPPTNGHISMLNNTFKGITTFRQSWINDDLLVFVQEGPSKGQFSFQVSDGVNTSPLSVFTVEAESLVLTCHTPNILHAYPNYIQPITEQQLITVTNDLEQSKPIIYTITAEPKHGSIVKLENGEPVRVKSFNQKDVNSSLIFYKHSGDLQGWTQNDSIEFTVNTLYAEPLNRQSLQVYISYGNLNAENKNQLIKTSPIKVDEGGEMIVAKNNLDVTEFITNLERLGKRASLRFSLKDPPRHGTLIYQNVDLEKKERFSQRNINSHQLIYQHDDSDTSFDTFNLTLHLRIEEHSLTHGENQETTFGLVLNISIQPVNDEPIQLVTMHPGIDIVQGFTEIINRSVLYAVDKDTPPELLVYEISTEPSNGHVGFIEDIDKKIQRFTQLHINEGRIAFKHNFHGDSGLFYFKLSDGREPIIEDFKVNVTKVYLSITKNMTIKIVQSNNIAKIAQDNINVTTNGLREKVIFTLMARQPRYGKIYVNGRMSNSFSQENIDDGEVSYYQKDKASGSDHFEFSVQYVHDPYSKVIFYDRVSMAVTVEPLVSMQPLEAPKGERVAITLHSLDASVLAERTGDNPLYTISGGPYFGELVKTSHSKRQVHQESYRRRMGLKSVDKFSHEDIVYMKVFYKSDIQNTNSFIKDNFSFVLTSYNAQPASGIFYIGLMPSGNIPIVPVTKPTSGEVNTNVFMPVTPTSVPGGEELHRNNETVEPSRLKPDHVIILAISIPLLIALIFIILIIYIVWRSKRKQGYTPSSKKSPHLRPQISGPFQIEQPHVHIEPQGRGSLDSEESKSLIVEYENTHNIPNTSRQSSEEADTIAPMIMCVPKSESAHTQPRSPDLSRTEVSSTVPTCKVTPLVSHREGEELEGAVGGCSDDQRQSLSSMGDMIDWITSDPELLEHCASSSPPELRGSKYWV
ncbi:chondroitin sulfate proteoglycan 4-like isoform X2 [Mya arenaria]|nr:chondroitin sulfate proteoglycan 4-like isoform X2 [Mya arenaria]